MDDHTLARILYIALGYGSRSARIAALFKSPDMAIRAYMHRLKLTGLLTEEGINPTVVQNMHRSATSSPHIVPKT